MGRLTVRATLRQHAWPASLLALAYLILMVLLWAPGMPSGADLWGHLFRAEYLTEVMRAEGLRAYFSTAWMPDWYLGDPFLTFYPPLTTLLLTPMILLLGSSVLALKVFLSLAVAALLLLTYWTIEPLWGPWSASLSGVLVVYAPYQLRTVFLEGNYPRYLALLALPVIYLGTERLLRTQGRRGPWVVVLSLGWLWAILAHPQQAYMFGLGFSIYVVARLFLEPDLQLKRAIWWVAGGVAGALLSAPWALPAYSHAELPNVPFLPVEKVELFSASLDLLAPTLVPGSGKIVLGTGLLLLALLATVARPDPRRTALLIAGTLTIWLALGPSGVLFSLLPLSDQLLPERFLNFTSFVLAIAASGLLPFGRRGRWLRALVVLVLVIFDAVLALRVVRTAPLAPEEAWVQRAVRRADLPEAGRWILFADPEPRASLVYAVGSEAPIVNGWALENTPHHQALRRYLSAVEWGPDYLETLLSRWNVAGAVVGPLEEPRSVPPFLEEAGFSLAQEQGDYQVWTREPPSGGVQRLPENRMLVLGDRLSPVLMTFPFAEEARVSSPLELGAVRLNEYDAVALYRFAEDGSRLTSAEERARAYVEGGGVLITDLTGTGGAYGRGIDFLGVDLLSLTFQEPMELRWTNGPTEDSMILPLLGTASWSGVTYQGLDRVLAEVNFEGEWYPVFGYRELGAGRAWFIGLNLMYYAQQAQLPDLTARLRDEPLADLAVNRSLSFERIPVEGWQTDGDGIAFVAEVVAEEAQEALVSYTYSPRFQATVDGQPTELTSFEGLQSLTLPHGRHSVEIDYQPFGTVWPLLGLAAGILGVVGLVMGYALERRWFIPLPAQPKRKSPVEADRTHAPCANCGFLLSEVGPPTSETYPFQVVHCPICGLTMDDEGFDAGALLEEDERQRRLARWLEEHNYDPQTVHDRWGFEPASFFTGAGEAPDLPELPEERGHDQ